MHGCSATLPPRKSISSGEARERFRCYTSHMAAPSPKRVAQRALVLSAVTMRAYLENEGAPDTAEYHQRMLAWLGRHPIESELEAVERSFVKAPIGKLAKKRVTDGIWRSEGLGVLMWALGYGKLPGFATECDQQRAAKRLGFMHDPVVLHRPKLVALAERRRYARLARALHWRLREVRLRSQPLDLVKVARGLPLVKPLLEAELPLVDGDLRLGRRAIHRASAAEVQNALSIAAERHVAANWLMGDALAYSEVDTPT